MLNSSPLNLSAANLAAWHCSVPLIYGKCGTSESAEKQCRLPYTVQLRIACFIGFEDVFIGTQLAHHTACLRAAKQRWHIFGDSQSVMRTANKNPGCDNHAISMLGQQMHATCSNTIEFCHPACESASTSFACVRR